MYFKEVNWYSPRLNKDMHVAIYGHGGTPFLVFPCQNSMCHNFADFGMCDVLQDVLEDGTIQLFCVDSVDADSWSLSGGDPVWRADRQENYFLYITEEVVPFIRSENPSGILPFCTGCSMGANHTANTFLRRPDLFSGMLAMSGVYDSAYFFGGWMNDTLYNNSPEAYMPNLPAGHPYIDLYNQKEIIFCIGQGAWEDGLASQRFLDKTSARKASTPGSTTGVLMSITTGRGGKSRSAISFRFCSSLSTEQNSTQKRGNCGPSVKNMP